MFSVCGNVIPNIFMTYIRYMLALLAAEMVAVVVAAVAVVFGAIRYLEGLMAF